MSLRLVGTKVEGTACVITIVERPEFQIRQRIQTKVPENKISSRKDQETMSTISDHGTNDQGSIKYVLGQVHLLDLRLKPS